MLIKRYFLPILSSRFKKSFSTYDFELRSSTALAYTTVAIARPIIENTGFLIIIGLSLFLFISEPSGLQAVPKLAALLFATQRIIPLLQSSYNAWGRLTANSVSIEKLSQIKNKARSYSYPVDSSTNDSVVLTNAVSVKIDSISFNYSSADTPLFNNSSLTISYPQSYAVVGPSGSGKSTFLEILCGLRAPSSGRISVNDTTISENGEFYNSRALSAYQSKIKYVTQTPFVYNASLLYNLTLTNDHSCIDHQFLDELIDLFALSDLIASRDLSSNLNESLTSLSGGQAQRVALVRALYQRPSFLVLDEITSALDPTTSNQVISSLRTLTQNICLIMVSHQQSSLSHCDNLISIHNNHISIDNL